MHARSLSKLLAAAATVSLTTTTPAQDPPPPANAIQFTENGDHLTVSPADFRFDFLPDNPFTIETWVYLDELPSATTALVKNTATRPWALSINNFGRGVFDIASTEPTTTDFQLPTGEWQHLAVTWDPTTNTKTIFLNGFVSASDVIADSTTITLGAANDALPSDLNLGASALKARLDETRIWSTALTPTQLFENHTRTVHDTFPGLLARWPFDTVAAPAPNTAKSAAVAELDGTLGGTTPTSDRYLAGIQLRPPQTRQYALHFDGNGDTIEIPHHASLSFSGNLTVEAWIRPAELQAAEIARKGTDGYGLGLNASGTPISFQAPTDLEADAPVALAEWIHVAVSVDTLSSKTVFYIDGQPAGEHPSANITNSNDPLVIGRNFHGDIDELRIWDAALSPGQIAALAKHPLGDSASSLGDLVAYWNFDEGVDASVVPPLVIDRTGNGNDGTFVGADFNPSAYIFGHTFDVPALDGNLGNLAPAPAAAGLWAGTATLNQVNEVPSANLGVSETVTPTSDSAQLRVLLHADAGGNVRLLKNVTVMVKDDGVTQVLLTDNTLIPDYNGIVRRGDKLVGLRLGSAAYDFVGNDLPLAGGIASGNACAGLIELAPDHPTNPFRHKYHPDHRTGRRIVRQISIDFDQPNNADPERINGTYRETVTGLHKIPLKVEGPIELTRISKVGSLNDE